MGKTYNFMKDILDGKIAVKKEHPEPGEYEYYYYDPTYPQDAFTPLTKIPTIPVPTADTPNPALQPGYRSRNYTPFEERNYTPVPQGYYEATPEEWNQRFIPAEEIAEREPEIYHPEAGEIVPKGYISPTLKNQLLDYEKNLEHPYLDVKGIPTACTGKALETEEEFSSLPWLNTQGAFANPQEIKQNYYQLKKQPFGNYKANYYKRKTSLRIPKEYCTGEFERDLQTRNQELHEKFPNFHKMDVHMQNALQETHYNAGVLSWPKLRKAATNMEKQNFCNNLHRKDKYANGDPIGNLPERNEWALKECRAGNFIK